MEQGLDDEVREGGARGARWRRAGPTRLISSAWRKRSVQAQVEVAELVANEDLRPLPQTADAIRRDSLRRRGLAVADLLALALAYAAMASIFSPQLAFEAERLPLLVAFPLWVLLNKLLGLYDADANLIHKSTLNELPRIVQSVLLGTGFIFLLGPLAGVPVSRVGTIGFIPLAIVLDTVLRYGVRRVAQGRLPAERCLIIGSGPVAHSVARKIESHEEYGAQVIGLADLRDEGSGVRDEKAFWLERPTDLAEVCRRNGVERIILAYCNMTPEQQLEAIQTGKLLGLKISVLPRLFEVTGPAVEVDGIEGMTLLGLRGFTRTRSSMLLKRMIDVTVSSVGLVLLPPLLAAVAVAIKLTSRGPVLYAQSRVGRHNRPFRLLKFRTMVEGADAAKADLDHLNEAYRPMFKIGDDPRVTRVGRFLRRTSLDELPQLWNVLKGEMSLVGPRPLVPAEDGHVIGWHRERLKLTPGLTGPWQVMGRTAIPFDEMIQLDYLYVAEWSLWNDFKLLIRTAPVVLAARGQ